MSVESSLFKSFKFSVNLSTEFKSMVLGVWISSLRIILNRAKQKHTIVILCIILVKPLSKLMLPKINKRSIPSIIPTMEIEFKVFDILVIGLIFIISSKVILPLGGR